MLKRYRSEIQRCLIGKVTTYTYDQMGNLTSITDANSHTTTFDYDEYNQLVKTTNPLAEQRLYSYDINGNLSMVVTPNGATIKFYNNSANILEKKFTPEGTVNYAYDSMYNITRATNADADLTFAYDAFSRIAETQIMPGFVQPATAINYAYDKNSNLTRMTSSNLVANYVYDVLNRLTDITDVAGNIVAHYEYDALSRRKRMTRSNNLTTNYNYDLASQLLSINHTPLAISNSYSYDNVGNRLSLTDQYGLHSYNYDDAYRLADSTNPNETYSYDPVGNRNPLTYSYDAGNRLLEDNAYTYKYDHNGNMVIKINKTTSEITTYTYNSEDQLIGVTGNISYKYDALGRRIEKNVNSAITRYVYDGEDIAYEYDGNNNLIAKYTHGPGIDEPISVEKNGNKYYYISDGLGSITAITDSAGNVVQTYRYDSFGNILNSTGNINQPYTFTGREYDSETGLYYFRARYYDPKIGRFLQEDAIQGVNLYSYCWNNPINLDDPWGYCPYPLNPFGNGTPLLCTAPVEICTTRMI